MTPTYNVFSETEASKFKTFLSGIRIDAQLDIWKEREIREGKNCAIKYGVLIVFEKKIKLSNYSYYKESGDNKVGGKMLVHKLYPKNWNIRSLIPPPK